MFLSHLCLSASALLPIIAASPTSPSPSPKLYALPQVARFENDPNAIPVVALLPVGIYLDIFFKGFTAVANGLSSNPIAGLIPQSPNNDIAYGSTIPATITQGTPMMTTVYADTTVQYFDLYSFYYGCAVALENGLAAIPTGCTVTATCVDTKGKTVASQGFQFVTTGGLTQNLSKATPIGFKGCQSVTFKTTASNKLLQLDVATGLDTISYTVYSTLPFSP